MTSTPAQPGRRSTVAPQEADGRSDLLDSTVRRDLVETLAALPAGRREEGLTAQELGELAGLHVTTVRFHLERLVAGGLLTTHSVRTRGVGRPRKKYAIAREGLPAPQRDEAFVRLAELLAETFTARTEDGSPLTPEQAGAAWAHEHAARLLGDRPPTGPATSPGAWLATVGRMIDVLRDWGYTPDLRTSAEGRTADIDIIGCPFIELARSRPEVVCAVHRGLMRGTLEVLGEPGAELELTPFATPTRCTAHVTTRTPFAPRGGTA
ncbi:helix-turn-helix transcriptional regulator [Janibacter terrae]|uniref:helix-turn-helix transcriptional regulator n=1 Tax=Janibacter terrae TaxID=103817 RepID=UPI001FDFFA36|nr:helix-turn-helix domain-containing protein [Janibacter terrae]